MRIPIYVDGVKMETPEGAPNHIRTFVQEIADLDFPEAPMESWVAYCTSGGENGADEAGPQVQITLSNQGSISIKLASYHGEEGVERFITLVMDHFQEHWETQATRLETEARKIRHYIKHFSAFTSKLPA